ELAPPSVWLLGRLGERPPATEAELRQQLVVDDGLLEQAVAELRSRGYAEGGDGEPIRLTERGRTEHERLVAGRTDGLRRLLRGWNPDEHPELRRLTDELARSLVNEMPLPREGR